MTKLTEQYPRLLLRIEEAAEILQVGRSTIYLLIGTGELPIVKIGRSRRIPVSALEVWVKEQASHHTKASAGGKRL